jgi:hypothetical protein
MRHPRGTLLPSQAGWDQMGRSTSVPIGRSSSWRSNAGSRLQPHGGSFMPGADRRREQALCRSGSETMEIGTTRGGIPGSRYRSQSGAYNA